MAFGPETRRAVCVALQELQEATGPELAAATERSRVSVAQLLRALLASGEIERAGVVIRGGRPAQKYRLRLPPATFVRLCMAHEEGMVHVQGELLNERAELLREREAHYALATGANLSGFVSELAGGASLAAIALQGGVAGDTAAQVPLLAEHWDCPVLRLSLADIFLPKESGALCLRLRPGKLPEVAWQLGEQRLLLEETLALLPTLASWADWEELDLSAQVEMLAELLRILCCSLPIQSLLLVAEEWSPRLEQRLRYSLASKLRQRAMPMECLALSPQEEDVAVREYLSRLAMRLVLAG